MRPLVLVEVLENLRGRTRKKKSTKISIPWIVSGLLGRQDVIGCVVMFLEEEHGY